MSLIDFNKPKKVKIDYGFEDMPNGGYMPQMSDADARKWKGKRFNKGKDGDRIEVRKSFDECQILIFIAKDGWVYSNKGETIEPEYRSYIDAHGKENKYVSNRPTKGKNVRISMNGPLKLSFLEWQELADVIEEAKNILNEKVD